MKENLGEVMERYIAFHVGSYANAFRGDRCVSVVNCALGLHLPLSSVYEAGVTCTIKFGKIVGLS